MSDSYSTQSTGLNSPAVRAHPVVPHATDSLPFVARALYVGGAGNISVVMASGGSPVTFSGVPAGTLLPIRVSAVRVSGTTATNMVALD